MKVPLTQVPSEQGNKRSGWMKHSGLGLKVQVEGTVSLDLGSSGPGESSAPSVEDHSHGPGGWEEGE